MTSCLPCFSCTDNRHPLTSSSLRVALLDTNDHVVEQCTGEAMQALVQMLVIGPVDDDGAALLLDDHIGMECLGQRTLGALHRDHIAVRNGHIRRSAGTVNGHACQF